MKDQEMILVLVVIFFLLGCSFSCSGMKEDFAALNSQGCPFSHPNRTQLLVHKPANFKYCYADRRCINWAPRTWAGSNNESACSAYTVQESTPSDFESEIQQRATDSVSAYDPPADEAGQPKIRGVVGHSFGTQGQLQFSNKTLRQCATESMASRSGGKGKLGHFEWKPQDGNTNCVVNAGWELMGDQEVGKGMGTWNSRDSAFKQYCVETTGNTQYGRHKAGCNGIRDKGSSYFVKPPKTCNLPSNSVSKNYGCAFRCGQGYYKDNGQCVAMNDEMKAACNYL